MIDPRQKLLSASHLKAEFRARVDAGGGRLLQGVQRFLKPPAGLVGLSRPMGHDAEFGVQAGDRHDMPLVERRFIELQVEVQCPLVGFRRLVELTEMMPYIADPPVG
jgi:hypothetical protein